LAKLIYFVKYLKRQVIISQASYNLLIPVIALGVLIMRVEKDNSGQMSIDFLLGITIFILAFLFLIMAIPQMFTPFQSNSDELTMIADRVGSTLVENELVSTNAMGEPLPGIVNAAKVNDLRDTLNDPVLGEAKRNSLGLDYGGAHPYQLQIELEYCDPNQDGSARIPDSEKFPNIDPGNQNVGQSRRFVYLRDLGASGTDKIKYYPGVKTIMVVRVWQS
jgi:hypothetical protein